MFEGNLSETYELPTYQTFSQDQKLALAYNSQSADTRAIVAADVTIQSDSGLPLELSSQISLGGVDVTDTPRWSPRTGVDGTEPALLGDEVTLRQSALVDVTGFSSGRYNLSHTIQAKYDCSTVSASLESETYIQNEVVSPYGSGWSIDGLQKLVFEDDGGVSIIDDNSVVPFEREKSFTEFEEEVLVFPAIGVQGLAIADFNGDGTSDIAYADSGTASIGIIYNFGERNFEQGPLIELPGVNTNTVPADLNEDYGPNLRTLKAIDVNADGLMDIVYGTQLQRRVDYLINEGGAGFRYEPGNSFPIFVRDVAVADFDNDGFEDVAISASQRGGFGNSSLYYIDYVTPAGRTLTSSFVENENDRVFQILVGDVDGDGDVDIGGRSSGHLISNSMMVGKPLRIHARTFFVFLNIYWDNTRNLQILMKMGCSILCSPKRRFRDFAVIHRRRLKFV